jgi:group II intron reverse transcriptase/maturase
MTLGTQTREVREMRTAEQILGIIRERGKRGLPLQNIYRQLYDPDLYLRAYARLYSNDGAMTPGTTMETVDEMSLAKIHQLIDDLRHERCRWRPVKRVYIPKKSRKLRPLGLPTWTGKLLQEAIRLILEAYYEPTFSDHSHGFRPGRGCSTALSEIATTWTGSTWFVEGDIAQCFDKLDHKVLISILGEKLHDNRFLQLIQNLLQAGYLEEWTYHQTLSGSPQGGVVSPILSNIYLDKLDKYVETMLLPKYNQGKTRKDNPEYRKIQRQIEKMRKRGNGKGLRMMYAKLHLLPKGDPDDPNYRRLYYLRYADDFLLGFAGPKVEAEEIKHQLSVFLKETLKLDLSLEKTVITHAQTEAARFLGYEIVRQHADDKRDRKRHRNVNGRIGLRVPKSVIEQKCALYMQDDKSIHRAELLEDDDFTIIDRYQSEYRGVVQYYLLATNVSWFNKLRWVMQTSLLKTLAHKHKKSVKTMKRKFQSITATAYGSMKCLEVKVERGEGKKPLVARFGGIPLRRRKTVVLVDRNPLYVRIERNELIKRLLANTCELCGSKENIEVHHIRKLADLKQRGKKEKPVWMQIMSARRRKTLITCQSCHQAIHHGRPTGRPNTKQLSASRVT